MSIPIWFGELIHIVDFLPFLTRGSTFETSYLLFCIPIPSEKGLLYNGKYVFPLFWKMVYLKGNNLLPWGANFSFKSRPFFRRKPKEILDITKTRLFKYTENYRPKNENFQIKNSDIFHISAQNIDSDPRRF